MINMEIDKSNEKLNIENDLKSQLQDMKSSQEIFIRSMRQRNEEVR